MVESEEELKNLLVKVKEESEKTGLKLKTKTKNAEITNFRGVHITESNAYIFC